MTIALGILAADGVVIAADTQENVGAMKVSGRKIFTRRDPHRGRAFSATGAGNSGYLDAISQRLAKEFERARSPLKTEELMGSRLLSFYRDHIFPLNAIPARERPGTELIVGLTWKGHRHRLFASEDSTLHEAKDHAAVGAGADFAMMMLDRVVSRKHDLPLELAGVLAAYVVFNVKEYMPDCGKGTHVTMLREGEGHYFSEAAIATMEYNFKLYHQLDGIAVNYMLGRTLKDEDTERDRLVKRLRGLRAQFLALPSAKLEPTWDLEWADGPRTPVDNRWIQEILGRAVIAPPSTATKRRATEPAPRRSKHER